MKTLKIALFAAAVFFITGAAAQQAPEQAKALTFTADTHNFGDIEQNKPVSHDFTFTNTSDKPVLITNVKPSCGCTVPNYPKTPIKPGEKGIITATFNAHAAGSFTKTLTVTTNESELTKTLYIKGKVIPTEVQPAAPSVQN